MSIQLTSEDELVKNRLQILRERTVNPVLITGLNLEEKTLDALRRLSTREKQVFQLKALGLSYEKVAGILGTKPYTIKNQAKGLRAKISFGVSSEELAILAFLSGLITQDDFELNKDSPFFLDQGSSHLSPRF